MAWRLRKKSPEEAEKLIKEGGKYKIENVKLLFLEGLLKSREGNRKGASSKFNKVVKAKKSHGEEYFLAVAFYEEGIIDYALKLFKMIASCKCEVSNDLFEESLFFLVKHDDYENVKSLCETALENKGYWIIDIADLLYDMNRPSWAKEFSSRALVEEELDEDDIYLHMLILNKTGEKEELLQFALKQETKAKQKNDFKRVAALKEIIRQVRTRGRFKE
jgi:tetratricopeptide (TPR) repeat protein